MDDGWVVVLAWNAPEALERCLDSLTEAAPPCVMVVDNASTDPGVEELRSHRAVTDWLRQPSNLGFAVGNNVGVRAALGRGARWVCLVNSDCLVSPDALARLRAAAGACPRTGAVGPLIRDSRPPHRIWSAGGRLAWRRQMAVARSRGQRDARLEPGDVDFVSGACLFAPREAWEKVGWLEEDYFLYFEDVDWCARARAHGLAVRLAPDAVVYHDWGASSRVRPGELSATSLYYSARNRRLAFRRAARALGRRLPVGLAWMGTLHYAAAVVLGERDKLAKLRAIASGVVAARRGERGRRGG